MNIQLFIRVASVNIKGSILSDLYIINYSLLNFNLIPIINKFQCFPDNENQLITLQWSINQQYHFHIKNYILYYSDITTNDNNNNTNDDLIRILTIPNVHQSSNDTIKSELNISLFNLNSNSYHILRLHLALIDQNENQLPMTSSNIYCILTRNYGKNNQIFLLIRNTDRLIFS